MDNGYYYNEYYYNTQLNNTVVTHCDNMWIPLVATLVPAAIGTVVSIVAMLLRICTTRTISKGLLIAELIARVLIVITAVCWIAIPQTCFHAVQSDTNISPVYKSYTLIIVNLVLSVLAVASTIINYITRVPEHTLAMNHFNNQSVNTAFYSPQHYSHVNTSPQQQSYNQTSTQINRSNKYPTSQPLQFTYTA